MTERERGDRRGILAAVPRAARRGRCRLRRARARLRGRRSRHYDADLGRGERRSNAGRPSSSVTCLTPVTDRLSSPASVHIRGPGRSRDERGRFDPRRSGSRAGTTSTVWSDPRRDVVRDRLRLADLVVLGEREELRTGSCADRSRSRARAQRRCDREPGRDASSTVSATSPPNDQPARIRGPVRHRELGGERIDRGRASSRSPSPSS